MYLSNVMPPTTEPQISLSSHDGQQSIGAASLLAILLPILCVGAIPGFIAYALGTINETQVVGGVIGILFGLLIASYPGFGLLVFVGLLYTRPEESIAALAGMHFPLIVALVSTFGMAVKLLMEKQPAVKTPLIGMIVGFAIAAIVSGAVKGVLGIAVLDFVRLVALVLLILNLVRTPRQYHSFVIALIGFTAYLAFYSAYLYYTGTATMDHGSGEGIARSRGTGIFSDPNDLAGTMVAGMALALARCVQERRGKRVIYLLLTTVMVWSIVLTNSRSGLMAMIVVIGGFALMFSKRKVLAISIALVLCGAFVVATSGRMKNFDSQEESANSRFRFWDEGLRQLAVSPLTGVGYTKFPDVNDGFVAHNSFVQCFAELGFPAYFFWMGCIYHVFRKRKPGKDEPEPSNSVSQDLLGARLAVVGYLTSGFWITRTYSPVMYVLFTLPVAQQFATSGRSVLAFYPPAEKIQIWGKIFGLSLMSIAIIWLLVLRFK
jgi:putative inorganic carbon (HCO3(-)) transporter